MSEFVVIVPPCSRDPCGNVTPSAGRNASSSLIDIALPFTFRFRAVVGPLVWYVPEMLIATLPIPIVAR